MQLGLTKRIANVIKKKLGLAAEQCRNICHAASWYFLIAPMHSHT
jgi:hypothetical protein